MSELIYVILILVIVGIGLGVINSVIPMARSIKTILNAVVVIAVIVWLLAVFGFIHIAGVQTIIVPALHA